MNGEKQITWEWRAGYDYATEKYKAELDRLRAERDDWKGCTGALKTIKDAKEKDFQAEIEKLHEECAGLRAQIHIARDEATMFQSKQCTELDRLRTLVKEMRIMLINVRMELKAHEVDKTGETYNNVELNALIAKTAKERE